MSNRIRRADDVVSFDGVIDTNADFTTETSRTGHTLDIVALCYRIVKKDGSMSGARACAASFRASRAARADKGRKRVPSTR